MTHTHSARSIMRLLTHIPVSLQESGQSLIQMMVGIGVLGITSVVFMTMFENQQKEVHAISGKLSAQALKSLLTSVFANGAACLYPLNGPMPIAAPYPLTFDSSTSASISNASISVSKVLAFPSPGAPVVAASGSLASPDSNTLSIANIQLTQFQGSPTNPTFTANWVISLSDSSLKQGISPIKIPVILTTSGYGTSATSVTGCNSLSAGGSGMVGSCEIYQNWGNPSAVPPVPPNYLGTRYCWGLAQASGQNPPNPTVKCLGGSTLHAIGNSVDEVQAGETLDSGFQLYPNGCTGMGPTYHMCSVAIMGCFQ